MNQKGFSNILILGIIAGVLVLGAGTAGYFAWKNISNTNITPVQWNTTVQPASTSSVQLNAPIDISSWKTYRNEKYGFEVKYPNTQSVTASSSRVAFTLEYNKDDYADILLDFYFFPNRNPDSFLKLQAEHDGLITKVDYFDDSLYSLICQFPDICLHGQNLDKKTSFISQIIGAGSVENRMVGGVDSRRLYIGGVVVPGDFAIYLTPTLSGTLIVFERYYDETWHCMSNNPPADSCEPDAYGKYFPDTILSTFKFVDIASKQDIIYFANPAYQNWTEEQLKADCRTKGGNFNACGSACLDPKQPCIQVCAARCEFK